MAKKLNGAGGSLAELNLKVAKETKGTYVYSMVTAQGVEIGGVYLPKLLFSAGKPADKLIMVIRDPAAKAETPAAETGE